MPETEQLTVPEDARRAAVGGRIVEAVKITRRETGVGLAEAKQAVDAYLQQGDTDGARPRAGRVAHGLIPPGAVAALHHGRLVDAIKQTRDSRRIGLKDAKQTVERYLDAHPHVRRRLEQAMAERRPSTARLVGTVILIALALLGAYWIARY